MRPAITVLAFSLISSFFSSCGFESSKGSEEKFESARLIALDAVIPLGTLQTQSQDPLVQEKEIRKQLKYSVGQLNGIGGAPHLQSINIVIKGARVLDDVGTLALDYSASLLISWSLLKPVPEEFVFLLPEAAEDRFIQSFLNDGDTEKRCLDKGAHGVDSGSAWYYYRPEKEGCELKAGVQSGVVGVKALLTKSPLNSMEKYPEYKKIWEDGRLVATLIFARNDGNSSDNSDAGISAYRLFYQSLIKTLGQPVTSDLPPAMESLDASITRYHMIFNTVSGPLDLSVELIKHIDSVDDDFVQRYNERTMISDFVSYSGHAGLGANIDKLMKMGAFAKGQYQIFRLNGCDSFAYQTDALANAHLSVNPEEKASKYLDLITNSQPSKFSTGSWEAMAIINLALCAS